VPKSYDVMEDVPWIDGCYITAANTEYDQNDHFLLFWALKTRILKTTFKIYVKFQTHFAKIIEKKRDYQEWIFSGFFVMKTDNITRLKWKPLKNIANNLKSYKKLF